jgi:hypothetical protein
MKNIFMLFAALILCTSQAWSDEVAPAPDKPSLTVSHAATTTAIVDAINHETREVTLRRRDGETLSFVVSEEAHNLDQVNVGDYVVANYIETLDIQVLSVDNAEARAAAATVVARAKEGEKPGVGSMSTIVLTATVEEINIEANTFKLKGPEGNIQEYTARNPENLKKAAVGDLVVIQYVEAIALNVEKAESLEP